MDIIKISLLGVCGVILGFLMKGTKPEYACFITVGIGLVIMGLAVGKIQSLKIPLPPVNAQKKNAEILDKFETLTASIAEGLPREIELRQKQYEYYRDLLFSFPKPEAVTN